MRHCVKVRLLVGKEGLLQFSLTLLVLMMLPLIKHSTDDLGGLCVLAVAAFVASDLQSLLESPGAPAAFVDFV